MIRERERGRENEREGWCLMRGEKPSRERKEKIKWKNEDKTEIYFCLHDDDHHHHLQR